jgi:addiction module HigA family antidote
MPKRLPTIHPEEHLKELMDGFGLTMNQLAKALHVSPNRVTAIVHGTRGITAETAMRLARYFGTSVQMWMSLQAHYEMEVAPDRLEATVVKQVLPRQSAAA